LSHEPHIEFQDRRICITAECEFSKQADPKTRLMKKKLPAILMPFLYLFISTAVLAQTTYKDVAPIFYKRCTSCHHESQHAPSMMNYTETSVLAKTIKADLLSGRMPPWPPDSTYHRYLNERLITSTEKAAILSWISNGYQKGDTTLAPMAPYYSSQYQLKGTPDLILRIPTFASNASASTDAYNCFALPSGLTSDRIIRAYEVVPGNIPIVHHVVANIDSTGTVASNVSGTSYMEPGYNMGVYAPGGGPTLFPNGPSLRAGMRLKAGSKIILQIHYPEGTQGQLDSTQIRIFFYPIGTPGIREMHSKTLLQNWTMQLPANQVTTATASSPAIGWITTDYSVFAAFPHAHKINVSSMDCAYNFITKDTIPLIRINKWDFEFQGFYNFPFLVKVPSGYTFYGRHIYDNTTNNPLNPNNPPKAVKAGASTTDEMLFDSFMWLDYQNGDDTINLSHILGNDPLVTSVQDQPSAIIHSESFKAFAFPNPFDESTTLLLTGTDHFTEAEFHLYDITGREVRNEMLHNPSGDGFHIVRGNLPAGVYFYAVKAGKEKTNGKMVLISK
jgi:hypothetical protein